MKPEDIHEFGIMIGEFAEQKNLTKGQVTLLTSSSFLSSLVLYGNLEEGVNLLESMKENFILVMEEAIPMKSRKYNE